MKRSHRVAFNGGPDKPCKDVKNTRVQWVELWNFLSVGRFAREFEWRDLIKLHLMGYSNCPEGVKMPIQWVENGNFFVNFLFLGRFARKKSRSH